MRYVVREYQGSGGYAVIWDLINRTPVEISSCRYIAYAAAEEMNKYSILKAPSYKDESKIT